MNARDFEKKLFALMFRSHERLTPHFVAYQLDISFEEAQKQLDQLAASGALRLEIDENGGLWYEAPGVERPKTSIPAAAYSQPQAEQPRMIHAPSRFSGLSIAALLFGGLILFKFLVPILLVLGIFGWMKFRWNHRMSRHAFYHRAAPMIWLYRR
jgi:hypothetical protein